MMVDWRAAWRNWILGTDDFGQNRSNGHRPTNSQPPRSQNQINADIAARRMGLNPADSDPFGGTR
jgi:hypothetical protein